MTIKKIGILVLAGIVAIGIVYAGYSFLRGMIFQAALAQAKAEYDQDVAEIDVRAKASEKHLLDIIALNEKKRLDEKEAHEKAKAKFLNDVSYFKSESADELRKHRATEAQWFAAKQADEIVIGLATDRIETQDKEITQIREDWRLSDIALNAAHKKVVDDLMLKFTTCKEWSDKLEAKLKPKPFAKVLQIVEIGAAFALGKML